MPITLLRIRPFHAFGRHALVLFFCLVSVLQASAQFCNPTPLCNPGSSTNPLITAFQTGMDSIRLGAVGIRAGRAVAGYRNLTCQNFVAVPAGSIVSFRAATSPNVNENLRVWIDWNNDGTFDPVNELAFSSDNARNHSGNIATRATAVVDTVLRVRISSEIVTGAIPAPCLTPDYGQHVDLGIVLIPNTSRPGANFTSIDSISCNGQVRFQDLSINAPTSWFWSFGDGNVSTLPSPTHFYPAGGRYTVKLIVANRNGSDSLERINYVTVRDSMPVAATCTPVVSSPCCGYGVGNFRFAGINTSNLGTTLINGYRDLTCPYLGELLPGVVYPISFNTSTTLNQDSRLFIDLNNDGDFDDANELVWSAFNIRNPTGNFITPSNVLLNQRVRARLISDYAGSPFTNCSAVANGAVLDFTVVVRANENPPVAAFNLETTNACSPAFTFRSTSVNLVDSLYWDFGDNSPVVGVSSSQVSISHTYTTAGVYSVKLVVVGPRGRDTLVRNNIVTYIVPPRAACRQQIASRPLQSMGIFNFRLANINVQSGPATEGYRDFTCLGSTTVTAGARIPVSITMGTSNEEQAHLYLDRNNDGLFDVTELLTVLRGRGTVTGNVQIPSSVVPNVALRLRIVNDAAISTVVVSPCTPPQYGQVEDYTIVVLPNSLPPVANFGTVSTYTCNRTITFTDSSLNTPSDWQWDFGDGNTSTLANPTHTYTAAGTYAVSLIVLNPFGNDTITRLNYITIVDNPVKPASCTPRTTNSCCNYGVNILNINNQQVFRNNLYTPTTYRDLSCTNLLNLNRGKNYPIRITSFAQRDNMEVYIDFNNNGILGDVAEERVFFSAGARIHQGTIQIPMTAAVDTVLRMRIISEANLNNNPVGACGNINFGQTMDMGVIISGASVAPVAAFTASALSTCHGTITFTDTSGPVVDEYFWDFGDGNVSTSPSPTHAYTATGNYTVKLIVRNTFGVDSLEKQQYVSVTGTWGPRNTACRPQTVSPSPNSGILRVVFNGIDRSSAASTEGYQDFTCTDSTTILENQNYTMTVTVPSGAAQSLRVYLDLNDNGIIEASELLQSVTVSQAANIPFRITSGYAGQVWNRFVRLRIISASISSQIDPCQQVNIGQAEDYAVRVMQALSLNKSQLAQQVSLSPNPSTGQIRLAMPNEESTEVTVLGADGKQYHAQQLNGNTQYQLNLESLPKGLYYLHLKQGDALAVKKLVLQ